MAITKDHAIGGAAIAVAMTLGATVMHAVSAPDATPAASAAPIANQPPAPPQCASACEALAKACPRTRGAGNCEAFLSRYAATDAGWTCAMPITDDVLRGLDLQDCVGGP